MSDSGRIAAFFDLDGTLMPLPSLEKRFFRLLRYRKEIPAWNYFLWIAESLRLLPHGMLAAAQANKMYLRGVHAINESGERDATSSPRHNDGHQAEGQASPAPPPRIPRLPVPTFFPQGLERLACHAQQGHEIVLLSGTLEPLAQFAAAQLETELAMRGVKTAIRVCATRLEQLNDCWTGKLLGEAMSGKAKARAARELAAEMNLDLAHCFAYGDSAQDRCLLSVVGKPAAVNPSAQLQKVSWQKGWQVLHWARKKELTQRTQRNTAQSSKKAHWQEASSGTQG